jgi:hypothetical protein
MSVRANLQKIVHDFSNSLTMVYSTNLEKDYLYQHDEHGLFPNLSAGVLSSIATAFDYDWLFWAMLLMG